MNGIWLVFRRTDRTATSEVRQQFRRLCIDRGLDFQERPTEPATLFEGRRCGLLSADAAFELYKRLHRPRVAVVSLDPDPWVSLHPDARLAIRLERLQRLSEFLQYKCLYEGMSTQGDPAAVVHRAAEWTKRSDCDGDHDPRVLPFFLFKSSTELDLTIDSDRENFSALHGSPARRTCSRNLTWEVNANAFHGTETLQVAGTSLRRGFHWDVQVGRSAGVNITTLDAVWNVSRYVNVFPDGVVRGRPPFARRL